MRRVMVASIKSGSGKTMASCALLRTWKKAGQETAAYKCGPDYIDPMFHQKAAGVPSRNLDTFFTGEEKVRELLLRGRTGREFAVLEGAMGLFDGLGGVREEGSSYHLAKVTKTPILLTVDAKGMGRSILSLIAGVLAYDSERLVKGVILNRISASYHAVIKPLAERELGVPVVGKKGICHRKQAFGAVPSGGIGAGGGVDRGGHGRI